MDEIIRGTTPTIEFVFSEINIQDIETAYIEIEQFNKQIIEKPFSDAIISDALISWTLTQRETLKLTEKVDARITCVWKLNSGLRGESDELIAKVKNTAKNEEI